MKEPDELGYERWLRRTESTRVPMSVNFSYLGKKAKERRHGRFFITGPQLEKAAKPAPKEIMEGLLEKVAALVAAKGAIA